MKQIRWSLYAVAALPLAVLLTGCKLDTETYTEVAEDGSCVRTFSMQAKDMDRRKEPESFPAKRFAFPAEPAWKVQESSDVKLVARAEIKAGDPIPGGYERKVVAVDRSAKNTVKLTLRDHYIATAYVFEETYVDTVKPAEFNKVLLDAYDGETTKMLEEFEKEFGESHDTAPARKYVTKDLRKLFEDTGVGVSRSGLWAAVGGAVFRLAFGGFPFKKVDQLVEADPREVLKALITHCLNKATLKQDAVNEEEEKAHAALVKSLTAGTVDEQAAVRKKIEALGPRMLLRLEKEARGAEAGSGAALRLDETIKAIRAKMDARRDALVQKLAKDTEEHYLKAPPDEKAATEKKLAELLGAHIEGNFAAVEYLFLVRVKLPGELAWFDENGYKLRDGTLRWNFSALNFFQRDYVCSARSRVWKTDKVEALSSALLGDPKALTLRQRSTIDDELAKMDAEGLKSATGVLAKCVEENGKGPLEKASTGENASIAAWAKKLMEVVTPAK